MTQRYDGVRQPQQTRENFAISTRALSKPEASKGTPATQNALRKSSEDKYRKLGWGKIYLFVSRENKRIKPIKQSNKIKQ